jgi:hypothetical protein
MPVKPWQMVVMALAVLGVLGSSIYTCSTMGEKVNQASTVCLVDIKTGDLFEAHYPDKKPVMYPAKRPDTKEAVLYPVRLTEDNKWLLSGRFLANVKNDKSLNPGLIVDQKSGEVKVTSSKPVPADVFGK